MGIKGSLKNFLSGERVDANSTPPYLLEFRSSKLFIIFTVGVAVFTDIFLYGIIVPVIPFALSNRAGVAEDSVQKWVSVLLAVYGGALLVGSPIAGFFADQSPSRRLPLLVGLFAIGGATVMLCLARVVWLIVLGRILQGAAAAVVWTVGTALLVDTVGEEKIGETLGWVSSSMGIGFFLAPLLGGIVYEKAGYYSVYYMSFALIAVDIILRLALIEKKIAVQWIAQETPSPERPGSGSGTTDLTDEEKQQGCDQNVVTTPQPTVERNSLNENDLSNENISSEDKKFKWPPVITLLASRRLLTALWGCVIQASMSTAFDSVLPLFVHRIFGWDSIGAGLIFLALTVSIFFSPLIGYASDKYGSRWLAFSGFIFAIPFWILLRLVTHNTLGQKVLFCALLFLIGIGLALVLPPLMAEITYVVEAKEREKPGRFGATGAYAQAYGLFIAAFAAGTLIGPVWAGYVEDKAGWGTMSWSLALFSLCGAVPCLIWTGGYIGKRNAKSAEERAVGVEALGLRDEETGSDTRVEPVLPASVNKEG